MRYPGGKGGAGVYQTIINQIPEHRVYIEAFAGGAAIFERKAPAASSILVERDRDQAELLRSTIGSRADVHVVNTDAVPFLMSYPWVGDEFVYLDPPYVLSTRTKKAIYNHEMTDWQHRQLLTALVAMSDRGVRFMLSGYRNAMYDDGARAEGWRRVDFQAMTRRGMRTESIWMNYPAPARLADYAYAGSDFRERERIKRKAHRWVSRWQQLPALEREALLSAMLQAAGTGKGDDGRSASMPAGFGEVTR